MHISVQQTNIHEDSVSDGLLNFYMSLEREDYYEKMVTDFMDTYCQSSFPKLVEMYLKQNGISKQDAGYVMNLIRTYTK